MINKDLLKTMLNEPRITINGVALTAAQSMTIRVALEAFAVDMSDDDALGGDETGRAIAAGYVARFKEIRAIMQDRDASDRRDELYAEMRRRTLFNET